MKVNFQKQNIDIFRINSFLVGGILLIIFLLMILILFYYFNYYNLGELEKEIEILEQNLDNLTELNFKFEKLITEIDSYKKLIEFEYTPYFWDELLIELGSIVPETIFLTGLSVNKEKIIIEGETIKSETIIEWMDSIRNSVLFKNMELIYLEQNEFYIFQLKGKIGVENF